jgi:branched-chain amino acid transport system ATP-binding protein
MISVSNVSMRYGAKVLFEDVSTTFTPGRRYGLTGPNGAGKTTLVNVISGLRRPPAGTVVLDGNDITGLPPHRRARLGMARTFQRLDVFGSLTVRENILVAAEIRRRWSHDGINTRRVTDEVMSEVGLRSLSRERCDTLPTGLARLVEVARALATQPSLLLLDEPSSGLTEEETADLTGLLERLAQRDMAVLLVEHDIDLVMSVCETVHVLDCGQILAAGPPAEIQRDPAVRAAYLGPERGRVQETAGVSA